MIRLSMLGLAVVVSLSTYASADDLVGLPDRSFVGAVNQQYLFAAKLAGAASNQAASLDLKAESLAATERLRKIYVELKRIADKWQIGTPGTLERPFSEDYDRIVGLSGAAFDQEYRAAIARSNTALTAAAADELKSGVNPDLRAFAAGPLVHATASGAPAAAPKP